MLTNVSCPVRVHCCCCTYSASIKAISVSALHCVCWKSGRWKRPPHAEQSTNRRPRHMGQGSLCDHFPSHPTMPRPPQRLHLHTLAACTRRQLLAQCLSNALLRPKCNWCGCWALRPSLLEVCQPVAEERYCKQSIKTD